MTKNEGKFLVEKKVEDFYKNEKNYLSKTFQETETRTRFIDPFFQALGWDFDQTDIPKNLWDVHREYAQRDNFNTKKPDYAFNIKGKLKFFVEAKAPWVPLTEKAPVFQAKRYAYSTNGKAPIVIITDFQEFRVFNAIERPLFDNPIQGLIKDFDLKYKDYLPKWDFIYSNFSKEAVFDGSINNLIGRITKETKTLDKEFLTELIGFREILAKNIAIRNKELNVDSINECVQRILDRLVFIRNLEDRDIEQEVLFKISNSKDNIYKNLLPLFSKLNDDYNGLLFKPDLSDKIDVDDDIIKKIIKNLYPPHSPFQFDIIEPELLGRIYEKFLGSKIRLTDSHQAKVEEKPEVRHAGGVFYTPQFIVENVVLNTLGKILNEKKMTPEEIEKIKILDPACGSGSFLLGAFDYLIKYHERWYLNNKSSKKYKDDFFETQDREIRLSIKKKSEILINNIFGVDIDREATEVAIMSLYLKLLDQGFDKGQGILFLKGHILPDMTGNIKCGNSLISREELFQFDMFGDDSINPFDWNKEFPFKFDVIIGNPPYIRIQEMQSWAEKSVEIYKKVYKSGEKGNFDIYVLFIEKSLNLLNQNGLFGMILPNKFFMADYGEGIRGLINKNIYQIIDFGDQQVFDNATTYTNLLFINKNDQNNFKYAKIKKLLNIIDSFQDTIIKNSEFKNEDIEIGIVENNSLTNDTWQFSFGEDKIFFEKLLKDKKTLESITDKILVGLQTSADTVYILEFVEEKDKTFLLYSKELDQKVEIEKEILKPLLKGKEIKRYSSPEIFYWLIFPYKIINNQALIFDKKEFESKYTLCWEYLNKNRKRLEKRDMTGDKNLWWQFGRNQNIVEMSKPKLITQVLASRASYTADLEGKYYFVGGGNAGGYGIKLKPEYDKLYYYLLGILNSSPIDKYLKHISTQFRGGFYSYAKRFIEKLPIYVPNPNDKDKFEKCKKIEEMVKHILEFKKQGKDKDAEFLESKVDEIVKEIYGLKG